MSLCRTDLRNKKKEEADDVDDDDDEDGYIAQRIIRTWEFVLPRILGKNNKHPTFSTEIRSGQKHEDLREKVSDGGS